MNLEESEIFSSELAKNNKQKKMVLALIAVLSIILMISLQNIRSNSTLLLLRIFQCQLVLEIMRNMLLMTKRI